MSINNSEKRRIEPIPDFICEMVWWYCKEEVRDVKDPQDVWEFHRCVNEQYRMLCRWICSLVTEDEDNFNKCVEKCRGSLRVV